MQFFLDTGNLEEIRTGSSWGLVDGVTTNPSLAAKEGMEYRDLIREIAKMVSGPISVETHSNDPAEMLEQAHEYITWAPNVVVKVPATQPGITAAMAMRKDGIKTNVTLTFTLNQALLAAKAGASFVSPFVGRLDDIGHDGMEVVRQVVQVYRTYGVATKVLASSLRHPMHVSQAALAGADVATIPFKVVEQLFKHPLTESGQERFLADWRKLQEELERRKAKV